MAAKPATTSFPGMIQNPTGLSTSASVSADTRRSRRWALLALAAAPLLCLGTYYAHLQYRLRNLANSVRQAIEAGKADQAAPALREWLRIQPRSAEAHYYRARLALTAKQPGEAAAAIGQALRLGFDRKLLSCLTAIIQARSDHFREAEPALLEAYRQELEPRAEVARELARGYLSTYRLEEAAEPIERWRTLAPQEALPYLWRNEIESRSGGSTATLIQNYRAALERDPNLDSARLGLARQLTIEGNFEEGRREYDEYLKRKPTDAVALVGLGQNALQRGEIEAATQNFENALRISPRQVEAHRELAQIDLRQRRFQKACNRLLTIVQAEPFDPESRYAYAQALRLSGDEKGARAQDEASARLREQQDQILTLRRKILHDPQDLLSRHQLATWMFEHGHADEGQKWAKEILSVDPGHVPTHRLLADYYAKQGDSGLANYHRLMASPSNP